ncbi:FimD/PapC N-terminal domain-containing protein [Rahnella victoriana]|jgi:outer membrane usher protein|nr:FimD/PapC N-terminal domain-containing protein [Rahnella victoriana]
MQKLATSKVETFIFRYRRKLVCLASAELLILLYSPLALGVEKYFDASALELEGPDGIQPVDLSRFTTPGKQLPGIYHVDIFINNKHTGKHDVNFVEDEEKNLTPEILLKEYRNAGLKINDIKELKNKQDTDVVTGLDKIIDGAYTNFNFKKQSLNINIPQALMN